MFENMTKPYLQQKAPATVVPHCMPRYKVKELYGLEQVYKLASNENPFGVSPLAKKAIVDAIAEAHLYSDGSREIVLKDKIAALHGYASSNVFISGGGAAVLSQLAGVFIQPGDEVIIPSPAYPPYYLWAFRNGGTYVEVPCREKEQVMDADAVLAAVTPRTKFCFLCNPNNPTSTAIPKAEMLRIIRGLPKTVIAVIDEAYIDFTDDPEGMTMVPEVREYPNMVVVRTFSKIYGMASVRLGYAIACGEIIRYLDRSVSCRGVTTFGIEGAIAALDDVAFREKTMENNRVERKYLTEELTAMGYAVSPSQSNFLWVDFGRPAGDVHDDLLPYGIIIRGDFGDRARVSIGQHHENEALVEALRKIAATH